MLATEEGTPVTATGLEAVLLSRYNMQTEAGAMKRLVTEVEWRDKKVTNADMGKKRQAYATWERSSGRVGSSGWQ